MHIWGTNKINKIWKHSKHLIAVMILPSQLRFVIMLLLSLSHL